MTGSSRNWRPTTVRRFIKSFPTSVCTALVETDAGPGYLKAMGNPEGPHVLACEWVGTQLAKRLGLSTFDFALIAVTPEDEIPFAKGGQAEPGPAFITRAESGEPWSTHATQLKRIVNPEDITRLVVFDTWTLNCDRYGLPPKGVVGRTRVNWNNVFLSEEAPAGRLLLKAIDHTHCFTCGRPLTKRLRGIDKIRDERVFALFPEFRRFVQRARVRQVAHDLRQIDRATAVRMIQTIPTEWDVARDVQDALVDLIVGRAVFVADTIEGRLWPQQMLSADFEDTEHPS